LHLVFFSMRLAASTYAALAPLILRRSRKVQAAPALVFVAAALLQAAAAALTDYLSDDIHSAAFSSSPLSPRHYAVSVSGAELNSSECPLTQVPIWANEPLARSLTEITTWIAALFCVVVPVTANVLDWCLRGGI
jgi:hypothetical protein